VPRLVPAGLPKPVRHRLAELLKRIVTARSVEQSEHPSEAAFRLLGRVRGGEATRDKLLSRVQLLPVTRGVAAERAALRPRIREVREKLPPGEIMSSMENLAFREAARDYEAMSAYSTLLEEGADVSGLPIGHRIREGALQEAANARRAAALVRFLIEMEEGL
jgi:hypothetical protein